MNSRLPRYLEIVFWDGLIYFMGQLKACRLYRLALCFRSRVQNLPGYRAAPRWVRRNLGAALIGLVIGFIYGIMTTRF